MIDYKQYKKDYQLHTDSNKGHTTKDTLVFIGELVLGSIAVLTLYILSIALLSI